MLLSKGVVVIPVGRQSGDFFLSAQAPCLFVLREGGKMNLHRSESSQKADPGNVELLPAADIAIHTSKGMWSAKARFFVFFFFSYC